MRSLALAGVLILVSAGAGGQPSCAPYDDVSRGLRERHGEVPMLTGITAAGELMVLFVNPATRTWTLAARLPQFPDLICGRNSGTDLDHTGTRRGGA